MKQFLEQSGEIIFVAVLAGIGVMARILLLVFYTVVGRACRNIRTTKNGTIAYIREELRQRIMAGEGIKSTAVYTECRLAESRVLGIRLGILEEIAEQSALLVLLGGVLTALTGVLREGNGQIFLYQLVFGGMAALAFLGMDLLTGLREKRRRIRLSIRDVLENSKAFYEWNTVGMPPVVPKRQNKEKQEEKCGKREKERKAGKKKEKKRVEKKESTRGWGGKQKGKAQEEKRRLTEELLRERRQLEARQLAQRREGEQKRCFMTTAAEDRQREGALPEARPEHVAEEALPEGRPEHVVAEALPEGRLEHLVIETGKEPEELLQAKEEAAATAISYEMLLHEVLAEYLG